ncbi:hypothetical protein N7466_009411 [Penicillium verhagenii]|uniref:uncharacterized protein n=1 Tax=Penicillium verhagenii TaxID=1562060 RepID=UPI0025454463|nr:uncharacterized protein N7466_009411 [Penicillium verhagenii]KAJ5921085.1 hypothetical protein N7466_009411 [Penicillium verhagenii]
MWWILRSVQARNVRSALNIWHAVFFKKDGHLYSFAELWDLRHFLDKWQDGSNGFYTIAVMIRGSSIRR